MLSIVPFIKKKRTLKKFTDQEYARLRVILADLCTAQTETDFLMKTQSASMSTPKMHIRFKVHRGEPGVLTIRAKYETFMSTLITVFLVLFGLLFGAIAIYNLLTGSVDTTVIMFIGFFWAFNFALTAILDNEVNRVIGRIEMAMGKDLD